MADLDESILQKAIEKAKAEYELYVEPDYIGNRAVFILCQYLQGVVEPDDTSISDLEFWVKNWYDLCDGLLVDEVDEPLSFTEIWAQFIDVWDNRRVKFPKRNHLALAVERASHYTIPRPEVAHLDDERVQHIAHVCYELQQLRGDNKLFIKGEDAGGLIGRGQTKGRLFLNLLVAKGVLELLKKGRTGLASEYRYIVNPVGKPKRLLTNREFDQKKKDILKRLKPKD